MNDEEYRPSIAERIEGSLQGPYGGAKYQILPPPPTQTHIGPSNNHLVSQHAEECVGMQQAQQPKIDGVDESN